jgi:hypothetical protein
MTSSRGVSRRKRTSAVEVANISKHGFWLLIENKERFVPFKEFPWFQNAAIGELLNVTRTEDGRASDTLT